MTLDFSTHSTSIGNKPSMKFAMPNKTIFMKRPQSMQMSGEGEIVKEVN